MTFFTQNAENILRKFYAAGFGDFAEIYKRLFFIGKNGGAWAARTPDHLIKSQPHNRYISITWVWAFYAKTRKPAQSINRLGNYFTQPTAAFGLPAQILPKWVIFAGLVALSGCAAPDPINPINIAPDGSYTPYIRWEIDSYEWGYRRMPVNWCGVYG